MKEKTPTITDMTWGMLKKAAEDAGITDDLEIQYIDISFPTVERGIEIKPDGNFGITISD